jgi:hypothetical protein
MGRRIDGNHSPKKRHFIVIKGQFIRKARHNSHKFAC